MSGTPSRMKTRGIALVSALMFLVVTAIFVGIALSVSVANRRLAADNLRTFAAQQAAEAGIENAIYQVWFRPHKNALEEDFAPSLEDLRRGLDEGSNDTITLLNGATVTYSGSLNDTAHYRTTLSRKDEPELTRLKVTSTGYIGEEGSSQPVATRIISETLILKPLPFPGFALLTNNADCVFCHTTVTSLEAAYRDGALLDFYNLSDADRAHLEDRTRVKVGVLENLTLNENRDHIIESVVTGTIYTRGTASDVLTTGSSLKGIRFKTEDDLPTAQLSDAEPEAFAQLCKQANACSGGEFSAFHQNYPLANYPDGRLPDEFPLPVEDKNQDRRISHSEWRSAIADRGAGRLAGGDKRIKATSVVSGDDFSLVTGTGSPIGTTSELDAARLNGIEGNLILDGSSSPLVIEDDVYVNGDVVINGQITGEGRLIARGNVYITGDLTYYCDANSQDFSISPVRTCDYSDPATLPHVVIAAVGNIVVGEYQSRFHSDEFVDRGAIDRATFAQLLSCTSPSDCGVSETDFYRYYHDIGGGNAVDSIFTPVWPHEGFNPATDTFPEAHWFSFAMTQMTAFNQLEYLKAKNEAGYIPRFYTMRADSPIYRCEGNGQESQACRVYFNNSGSSPKAATAIDPSDSVLNNAVIVPLSPTGNWWANDPSATEASLEAELKVRGAWIDHVETNQKRRGPLEIDGVLYSSNAVFTIAPESSVLQGEMILRGSLIAADTGVLVPGAAGLRILYDARAEGLLGIMDTGPAVLLREGYKLETQE